MTSRPPPTQIALLEPSFKSLLLELRVNGKGLATATGYLALSGKGPVLITNRHVLTGRHTETGKVLSPTGAVPDEVLIHHNRQGLLGQWITRSEPLYNASTPIWTEHPTMGAKADIAALPLTALDDVALLAYDPNNVGPLIAVMPSDVVSVVGFPFGLTAGGALGIWATGFVASEPAIDYKSLPLFLIDCRARPGQSGSPVVAHRNAGPVTLENGNSVFYNGPMTRFLGTYSGRINAESDLGFVWKATACSELVAAV